MGRKLYILVGIALGFVSFFPYPALPVGNNTAVQFGNILTVGLVVPLLWTNWRSRPYYLYGLLFLPLAFAMLKVGLVNEEDLGLTVKTVAPYTICGLTLLAAQFYLPRCANEIMTGIAIAILVHVGVGLWQEYVFYSGGDLPLQFLYSNVSFLSVTDFARDIVRYERRPFGIFPEPSAMSSSLAPFVLLWAAEFCGIIEFVQEPARWQRMLYRIAAIGGAGLIILSRSGHAMGMIAGLLVFGAMWLKNARATPRNMAALTLAFGVVLPAAVWLTYLAVGDRVLNSHGKLGDSSWNERSESLLAGLSIWSDGDIWTLLFGLGPGRSSPLIFAKGGMVAVFSVVLTYVYETGLAGAAVVGWIGYLLCRFWRATRFNAGYATIAAVWVLGIVITTSYYQLLSIWITLGLLTVWPSVCRTPAARKRQSAEISIQPAARWIESTEGAETSLVPWGRE